MLRKADYSAPVFVAAALGLFFIGGLLTTLVGVGWLAWVPGQKPPPIPECALVENFGGGKPITLTYKAKIDPTNVDSPPPLRATADSEFLSEKLASKLPAPVVAIAKQKDPESALTRNDPQTTDVTIKVQPMRRYLLRIGQANAASDQPDATAASSSISSTVITVPDTNPTTPPIEVPIPRARSFGNSSFALALSDSGAITSVTYSKTASGAAVLNGLETDASKANAIKAEADLIAQQQRLILCKTKPEQCTK